MHGTYMQCSPQQNSEDSINYHHRFVLRMHYRINLKQDPTAECSESVPKPKHLLHQEKLKKKKKEKRARQQQKLY